MSLSKKYLNLYGPVFILVLIYLIWIYRPVHIFQCDYSTLVFDQENRLIRAFLSSDEQYRFPMEEMVLPDKYVKSLILFEDKRFYRHPGFDVKAIVNAAFINIKSGSVKRGGSTITMQVARLAKPKPRTVLNKLLECAQAFRYSVHVSKNDILKYYAAHVPMGSNIVGISAASYCYYNKPLSELTWAEAALFVVLPNSPGLLNLEKGREQLFNKRNTLLLKLFNTNIIDKTDYLIACDEPLPTGTKKLPFLAPHFTEFVKQNESTQDLIHTTLDLDVQAIAEQMMDANYNWLSSMGIKNAALLIAETGSGNVSAYVGSHDFFDNDNQGQVDGVISSRSTGSLLKPFLAANVLDRGPFTIQSVLKDVPTFYGTFAPQNATKTFHGLVTIEEMLVKSLNVPAVRLLNQYGINDFYFFLQQAGFKHLFRSPDGYGLSLILGGAEASLWELLQLYVELGNMGKHVPVTYKNNQATEGDLQLYSKGSSWQILETLKYLQRPGSEYYWQRFNDQVPVAWKTGTSYGQKDGWAIGVNKQWTIGVWVGNFTGEGNASISGASCAAPMMFDLFNALTDPQKEIWFDKPKDDLVLIECCKQSGYPAGPDCSETVLIERPKNSYIPGYCPFHQQYIVDEKNGDAVCSLCWHNKQTTSVNLYVVPPLVKEVLEKQGVHCDEIPNHARNCPVQQNITNLELIYPLSGIKILVPRDFDGKLEKIVFSAKHHNPSSRIFWYLDGKYLRETQDIHNFPVSLDPGIHQLTVQDQDGFKETITFQVFQKTS